MSRTSVYHSYIAVAAVLFKRALWVCPLYFCAAFSLAAQSYTPPLSHRADLIVDSDWRFIRQDIRRARKPPGSTIRRGQI